MVQESVKKVLKELASERALGTALQISRREKSPRKSLLQRSLRICGRMCKCRVGRSRMQSRAEGFRLPQASRAFKESSPKPSLGSLVQLGTAELKA